MTEELRIAVCGDLKTACEELRKEGVVVIDTYSDSLDLTHNLRLGYRYHLILVYAPQGEGFIDMIYPYKRRVGGRQYNVPVRLLNEPTCHSAILELKKTIQHISRELDGIKGEN